MATSFPTGTDNFNIPNSPGSTALSSSGTGSRNHVQHHRDIGDAIEAMQAEATLAVHSHDGSTARHGSKLSQANTHENADTDLAASSIHHTLGPGVNQAAPGNHASLPAFQSTHSGAVAWPVGSIFITTVSGNPADSPHSLGGTWTQIQDAFLIGVGGSYSYSGSVVNNSSSHTHTISNTSSAGSHSHTVGNLSSAGIHQHSSSGDSGGTNPSHTHTSNDYSLASSRSGSDIFDAGSSLGPHTHTSSGVIWETNLHTHTIGTYSSDGSHSHTSSGTSLQSGHTHTTTTSSTSHLPPWKAFYMWRRTA